MAAISTVWPWWLIQRCGLSGDELSDWKERSVGHHSERKYIHQVSSLVRRTATISALTVRASGIFPSPAAAWVLVSANTYPRPKNTLPATIARCFRIVISLHSFHKQTAPRSFSLIVSFPLYSNADRLQLKEDKHLLELPVVPIISVTQVFCIWSFRICRCLSKQAKFQKKSPCQAGNSRTFGVFTTVAFSHFVPNSSLCLALWKSQSIHPETHRNMKISHEPKLKIRIMVLQLYKNSGKYALLSLTAAA